MKSSVATATRLTPSQINSRRGGSRIKSPDIYEKEILLEPRLLELIRLRIAQICNCRLCIDHHAEVLKGLGELDERIRRLPSWRESSLFKDRERAALAISEALVKDSSKPVSKEIVREAHAHFNNAEVLQLTLAIFAIKDWAPLCDH